MNKRQKTISGLECCTKIDGTGYPRCERCPYADEKLKSCKDVRELMADALALLKAQEPHLLTEADFENNSMVDQNGKLPAWCEHKSLNGIAHDVDGWTTINQGWVCGYKYQRYWSAQPTDEQRKKVPWDV